MLTAPRQEPLMPMARECFVPPKIVLPCCHREFVTQPEWACFSADRSHRFTLWRRWDWNKPLLVVLMLNPSVADEYKLDLTLKKIRKFALRWGYGGFEVVNAFSFVSTQSARLVANSHDRNLLRTAATDEHILRSVSDADRVMVGWGVNLSKKQLTFRISELRSLIGRKNVLAWKITNDGQPHHPLYLADSTDPVPFSFPDESTPTSA